MIFFLVVLWFILTFAVIAPLEWWLLPQHLKAVEWWILITFIGWILYSLTHYITGVYFFNMGLYSTMFLEGAILGLLMGFLRELAFESRLAQAKRVIASSVVVGVLSHFFSLYSAFYLVRNQEGLAQAGLLAYSFMFCLTLFYHTLNTVALIWLLRDASSPNQSVDSKRSAF